MRLTYKPSRRFSEYLRRLKCDHWEEAGLAGNDKAVLRHRHTGQTVAYGLHDGGNDWNGPRNLAAAIQRICGCSLIEARGRKRSRKSFKPSGFSIEGTRTDAATSERIAALNATHGEQRAQWEALTSNPCRDTALKARDLLPEIKSVEEQLGNLHQPVDRIVR